METMLLTILMQAGADESVNFVDVVVSIALWAYHNPWPILMGLLGFWILRWAYGSSRTLVEGTGPVLAFLVKGVTWVMTGLTVASVFVAIWVLGWLGDSIWSHSMKQMSRMESNPILPGTPFPTPDATQPAQPPPEDFPLGLWEIQLPVSEGTTCTLRDGSNQGAPSLGEIPNGTQVRVTSWVESNYYLTCGKRGFIEAVAGHPAGYIHCVCVEGHYVGP